MSNLRSMSVMVTEIFPLPRGKSLRENCGMSLLHGEVPPAQNWFERVNVSLVRALVGQGVFGQFDAGTAHPFQFHVIIGDLRQAHFDVME